MNTLIRVITCSFALLISPSAWAVDSYRYLHVTIDTPWLIFVFLFFLVFAPMILSAILYVHNAMKKKDEPEEQEVLEDKR